MSLYWSAPTGALYHGPALEVLRALPAASVHVALTSPPYWGHRLYGEDAAQLGQESTVQEYVGHLADILNEVGRVLRPDGVLWLVLGDTYATGAGGARKAGKGEQGAAWDDWTAPAMRGWCQPNRRARCGVPAGNLAGVPWRVAFALQDAGWILRQTIIWNKPNARPESVRNRPATRHEYVFLLTRHPRDYFWDALGARAAQAHHSVWSINVSRYDGPHPATFPLELAHRCLSAAVSPGGCCAGCKAQIQRIVRAVQTPQGDGRLGMVRTTEQRAMARAVGSRPQGRGYRGRLRLVHEGWALCPCGAAVAAPEQCVVLDPFIGSGTSAAAAERLGHRWIGVELMAHYLPEVLRRVRQPYLPLEAR